MFDFVGLLKAEAENFELFKGLCLIQGFEGTAVMKQIHKTMHNKTMMKPC